MKKECFVVVVLLLLLNTIAAQKKAVRNVRLGPGISFGLSGIATNTVGLGGIVGAEVPLNDVLAVDAEASYCYFTGDKMVYSNGKNKAFTLPVLTGLKAYLHPQVYLGARAGAIYFMLNEIAKTQVRLAYGLAGGVNLPKKINLINTQVSYTSFRYNGVQRGYATLAVAIIIN